MTAPEASRPRPRPVFLDDDRWHLEAWDRYGEGDGYEPHRTFEPILESKCVVCGRPSGESDCCGRCERDGLW